MTQDSTSSKKTTKYIRNCSACGGEHRIEVETVEVDLKLDDKPVTHVGVCPTSKKVIFFQEK